MGSASGHRRPLLLDGETVALLAALWRTDLLADAWPLRTRQVRWGCTESRRMTYPALAVDGATLTARALDRLVRLHPRIVDVCDSETEAVPGRAPAPTAGPFTSGHPDTGPAAGSTTGSAGGADWTVTASPSVGDPHLITAGRRHVLSAHVTLRRGQEEDVTILETVPRGWVHLFPIGGGGAVAQAMIPGPAERPADLLADLLTESGLGARLARLPDHAHAIPAAPRLLGEQSTPGRLVVGTGALRLDPIAGTGTAQALRTAILAAAIIVSAGETARPYEDGHLARYLAHFRSRLHRIFRSHLLTCTRLYAGTFTSPDWHDELRAMRLALRVPAPEPTGLFLARHRLLPAP
ncbi:hypothetical protein AB0K60_03365 [Thermopolyspora sp. NPDC052614]|uniref:hypothetical protein n=1 Tax=Thermopolyspora sp. NPDC052614 TaxID=3155682 RepID=UPI00342C4B16